ncbi:YdcF family protein [Gordonia paraffinivorans]|uniref:YdcF family protein n=1 Tax=Gordonia paraffinivorans TaxID=175628 RepID=UPI00058D96E3|nr:YdcF family protein [Gordonia paraffinivorans]MCD2145536.1 YdcF family protein [Gordonia paraffinivorans]
MRLRRIVPTVAATVAVIAGGMTVSGIGDPGVANIESTAASADLGSSDLGSGNTGSADISRGDFGSVDFGSSEFGTRNSLFLWESPPTRYIVVLGAKFGVLGQTPEIMKRRLNHAAKLAKQHPFNRVIVSGGDTHWLPITEAQFMNVGLIRRGIPVWQMVNEGKSTSTVQNAENTVRMLKRMGATGAVIVTNDFHMDRALKNFRDAAKAQGARLVFRPAYA